MILLVNYDMVCGGQSVGVGYLAATSMKKVRKLLYKEIEYQETIISEPFVQVPIYWIRLYYTETDYKDLGIDIEDIVHSAYNECYENGECNDIHRKNCTFIEGEFFDSLFCEKNRTKIKNVFKKLLPDIDEYFEYSETVRSIKIQVDNYHNIERIVFLKTCCVKPRNNYCSYYTLNINEPHFFS